MWDNVKERKVHWPFVPYFPTGSMNRASIKSPSTKLKPYTYFKNTWGIYNIPITQEMAL